MEEEKMTPEEIVQQGTAYLAFAKVDLEDSRRQLNDTRTVADRRDMELEVAFCQGRLCALERLFGPENDWLPAFLDQMVG